MTEEDCEWTLVGNPVLDFFMEDENSKKMLSTRTLAKRIGLRQKDVFYHILNCDKFERVQPIDVGYNGSRTRVFKLKADI
tara:strand:+ start:169 stop:408 length:240 start_codon:yes stop_codon:yes gene_type:complete